MEFLQRNDICERKSQLYETVFLRVDLILDLQKKKLKLEKNRIENNKKKKRNSESDIKMPECKILPILNIIKIEDNFHEIVGENNNGHAQNGHVVKHDMKKLIAEIPAA